MVSVSQIALDSYSAFARSSPIAAPQRVIEADRRYRHAIVEHTITQSVTVNVAGTVHHR